MTTVIGFSPSTAQIGMSGAILQGGVFPHHDWIPALLKKRIATWSYLMRVFRGGMVLYNTAWISEHEMRLLWNEDKMQRRYVYIVKCLSVECIIGNLFFVFFVVENLSSDQPNCPSSSHHPKLSVSVSLGRN